MKVSVITICFNDKAGLEKTILSTLNQTRDCVEFIVIDGGSTDGGKEILDKYSSQIDFCVSEPDKGIYNAMNKGVEHATGDYCIFMNSGDVFSSSEVVSSFAAQCDGSDIVVGSALIGGNEMKDAPGHITMKTLYCGSICHQAAFIKTGLLKRHPYDESLKIVSDRKFFVQTLILDSCSYQKLDFCVADYDITGFSSMNPVASRLEYDTVLEELIPSRIRVDYAEGQNGRIVGDGPYEKFFTEVGRRKYKAIIYRLSHVFLSIVALFKKSASFVSLFPKHI